MKKFLILIIFILIVTGCKVEYNLVINENLTVSENITMTGTDDFFSLYYKSSKLNAIKAIFIEARRDYLIDNGYQYEIVEDTIPYILAKKKYNNLEEFASQTIFSQQYFDNVSVLEKDGIVSMQTNGFNPFFEDSLEQYDIKNATIKIKLPFKVVEHNASDYDEKNNTYTWYINDDMDSFSILLSYNTSEVYEYKDNNNWYMIIVGILMFIGIIIANYVLNKKNK